VFKRLCIIGLGLIGGSIARAARDNKLCQHIVAYAPPALSHELAVAQSLGIIDAAYDDIALATADADCIIIATPVGAVLEVFKQLKPHWRSDALYSDACSTKGSVVAALQQVMGIIPSNFVPAHPIAGSEKSGVTAATADLFCHRRLIITPTDETSAEAVKAINAFWAGMGAEVSTMAVDYHDTVLAATSHLPHVLAFALVGLLGRKDEQAAIFKFAAGGFKDFSRIASSDPTMWQDICLANKTALLPLIQQMRAELATIEDCLQYDHGQALFDTFVYARNARLRFLDTLDEP
jgi:prephenate dehydrogenase